MNIAITGSEDQKESVGWPPARHHKVRQYIGSRRGGLKLKPKSRTTSLSEEHAPWADCFGPYLISRIYVSVRDLEAALLQTSELLVQDRFALRVAVFDTALV